MVSPPLAAGPQAHPMVPGGGPARSTAPRVPAPAGLGSQSALLGMANLANDIKDLDRLRSLEARLKFHLVVIPEDGRGACETLDTVDAVIARLRPLIGQRGQVFIFHGDRWNLTKGVLKFLVPPPGQGERVPLFQGENDLTLDLDGGTDLDPVEPEDAIRHVEVAPEDALPPGA